MDALELIIKRRDELVMQGTDFKQQIVEMAENLLLEINWAGIWERKLDKLEQAIKEYRTNQENIEQYRIIIKEIQTDIAKTQVRKESNYADR